MSGVHSVLGQEVRSPVEVRAATACSALFAVDPAAARDLLEGTGLAPVRYLGRAVCSIAFVRHIDTDLGPYHEFSFGLLVRYPDRSGIGVFIGWLPVNQEFACVAGRDIWGFPKEVVEVDIAATGRGHRCEVRADGERIIAIHTTSGLPAPGGAGGASVDAYTHRDGVLRRTPWTMNPAGVRIMPGGSRIELGTHPGADRFRALGLPKRALFTSRIGSLTMQFDDAEDLS
ncbi:acetoacetate decarboxylase family protein [Nocardia aurantia]|uniref:acetoacetate decarboxylase family protein n=1 Tax=Nocardia aurantia TaxID=2585199 RepID=UPI0029E81B91|nr:acetoacetate decarboxylase family protein [Nocardia aurantia]